MPLHAQQLAKLRRIVSLAESLIDGRGGPKRGSAQAKNGMGSTSSGKKRVRRTAKDVVAFRRLIKSERKKGTPAAALARKHGVSTAYIYMIR